MKSNHTNIAINLMTLIHTYARFRINLRLSSVNCNDVFPYGGTPFPLPYRIFASDSSESIFLILHKNSVVAVAAEMKSETGSDQ